MTYDHTLTGLYISAALGLMAALITIWSVAYIALSRALDTRTDRRARKAARVRHTRVTAAHDDTVTTALDSACCERWWTSCGFQHDPTCPNQTRNQAR